MHRDHEGEHWNSYLPVLYSTLLGKVITRLNYIEKLSPKAKVRYKAINLYSFGDYSLEQICEIFEINRSTFYRWKSFFNGEDLIGFSEDRMRTIRWKDLSLIPQVAMDSLNPVYPVIDAFNEKNLRGDEINNTLYIS